MDITEWIWQRLDADLTLSEEAKYLVGAAVEGQAVFAAMVEKTAPPTRPAPASAEQAPEPAKAFLKSIQVEGFRGIGQKSTLTFKPTPGLVVVAGRNGSGKSSFADGLQLALSRRSGREKKRPTLGSDLWRNLHRPDPATIQATFAVEGRGDTVVGISWAPDAGLEDHTSWSQLPGQERTPGTQTLGWDVPLELYSPMLSYDELGGIFDGRPSELYDALESFLGLGRITDAAGLLAGHMKDRRTPSAELKTAADSAKAQLAGVDDARGRDALAQIAARRPDAEVVRSLLAGSAGSVDPQVAAFSRLAALTVPTWEILAAALVEMSEAAAELADATAAAADAGADRDDLLLAALDHHRTHGDELCPVCGVGTLDSAWASNVQQTLDAGKAVAERRTAARARKVAADGSWQRLLPTDIPDTPGIALPELAQLQQARSKWDAVASDPLAHGKPAIQSAHSDLAVATSALASAAAGEERTRQNRWAEIVPAVATWITKYDAAAAAKSDLDAATQADKWLKDRAHELRNERLEPLAAQARHIWSKLRQESNVDLGSVTLDGIRTTRKVSLTGTVDGTDVGGLSVMSQGELHALALALFIPRATAAESPFGFIILDDPIQAMDPSKIDGFVDVLAEIAQTRQVIVFSHDDRLPDAIRQMAIPARVLEIVREKNSVVRTRDITDPVGRYLKDATTIAREDRLSEEDRLRVIPGLCRMAIEAACRDHYFARELSSGASRHEVEEAWQNTHETRARLKLTLAMDDSAFETWLTRDAARQRGLGVATSGFHQGLKTTPELAVSSVSRLIEALPGSVPKS